MLESAMDKDNVEAEDKLPKKSTGAKSKNKNGPAVEKVLKSLNEIPASLKLGTLAIKYVELDELRKSCEVSIANLQRQCINLQREKDHLETDNGRQILARTHLEGLCRELHRLNKIVKDDSVDRLREEEERRRDVTARFESTLGDITGMMEENSLRSDQLRDDNLSMSAQIKRLYKDFKASKEEHERLDHQLDLERQLTKAQNEKAQLEMQTERALWIEERATLTEKWKKSEDSCKELQSIVKDLCKRMETYDERHTGYKSVIDNNCQFLETCKSEIRSMNRKVTLLEKEIVVWKDRSQQNALKALDISALKQAQDAQLSTTLKKVDSLQSLCRQLQEDRSSYLKILKANGINTDIPTTNVPEKSDMPLHQKELLLKPVLSQLNLVKKESVTKRDQLSINAIRQYIDSSKTYDSVHIGINLLLGFINYKNTINKSRPKQISDVPLNCISEGNSQNFRISSY